MIKTEINNDAWQTIDEIQIEKDTPYWIKLNNNNIVLSIYLNTGTSSGWAKAFLNDKGYLIAKGNEFYILSGAKLQSALKH